jgi:hypothetical protein
MNDAKKEHCCDVMDYYVATNREEHELIRYHAETRNYNLLLHGYDFGLEQDVLYCPWCGNKLPERLNAEWCEAVKNDCGIDEVYAEEWEKLPEKYRTDQWWKELGL